MIHLQALIVGAIIMAIPVTIAYLLINSVELYAEFIR